ncbi:ADP-ribosylglycohydrolase family protein [Actinocrinis puniceicyclus]|uniref:ADP-ribosylglycohydrolase family protein n=1 Tax=Actinocrinis puniceicyclus TaxID=977794 RepID=A0A8J8BGX3_9ACTN|nr:ADP-ribosylglycohydrolase family protein [Actinocrinis puniceicyclus]MBS2966219.1 ADP-ribosylglycohydrolase family protein [Actinocrinis puniceicyclus]
MFGLAYGDALGKPTEFMRYDEIVAAYGPGGPQALEGDPALVTDDTQMTLCVADALLAALEEPPLTAARLEPQARVRFMAWAVSPENDRAPGMTCMQAIGRLAAGTSWVEASERGSKGCGANMRVAPIGLVPGLTDVERAAAAQLQAALTHGHPTALAASELTAFAVHWLRTGLAPAELPATLRERCREQRTVYHGDWLGELWQSPGVEGPEQFMARGWDECVAVLDRLDAALASPDRGGDPCAATGEGWIAQEALATAVHCFLLHPGDPVAALGRAAATSGDSDSIASLAGAFAGAAHGFEVWPAQWARQIEYAGELERIGRAWD